MTPRILICLQKTGDIIGLLPILYADAKAGRDTRLMTCAANAQLLSGCSYVKPIYFEGGPDQVELAIQKAKVISTDVRVCQMCASAEVVSKYCRNGDEKLDFVHSSFMTQSWKLAGAADLWPSQPPLIFDRRSEEREAELVKQQFTLNRGKLLIACSGKSSPFPYKRLLMELIYGRFRKQFSIVDLDAVKAERIYDLLGLFDRAKLLIATDSALLHLAAASPKLPVVALVNDKPSLIHGSPWRTNHIVTVRYRDFPKAAIDMLDAIQNLVDKGAAHYLADVPKKLIHVWSRYHLNDDTNEAHVKARSTWFREYHGSTQVVRGRAKFSQNWVECPIWVGAIGRDSKVVLNDDKRFPYVHDIINMAAMRGKDDDIICLTRHDTCFTDGLTQLVQDNHPCYAHRIVEGDYHPSVDMFAFSKYWWKQHAKDLPDFIWGADRHADRILCELLRMTGARELPFAVYKA